MTESAAQRDRMLVCAHRHGNDLTLLRAAEDVAVDLVEVDVHLFRGALDARHSKTVGPLPIVWDRRQWPSWNPPRQAFDEILESAQPETVFYVDLKGWSRRLSRRVMAALEGRPRYVVSSRAWWLLRPFRARQGVEVLRSIGASWQLRWFLATRSTVASGGVSIRRDLLDHDVAMALKERTGALFVWGVASSDDAAELERWGVDGVIVDNLELARALLHRNG